MKKVAIIGGGFAGCEAAALLSKNKIKADLFEMKPENFSPAHSSPDLCEVVCSNSFKAERISSAAGLLKAEMKTLGSLSVSCAEKTKVPPPPLS